MAALLAALPLETPAQDEALVSKSVRTLLGSGRHLFAFGDSGTAYSQIDVFADPPDLRNGRWLFRSGVQGGIPWKDGLIVRGLARTSDTTQLAGIGYLEPGGFSRGDTLSFFHRKSQANRVNEGAGLGGLAIDGNTLAVAAGRLGLAYATLTNEPADGPLSDDSLSFWAFPEGEDGGVSFLRCELGSRCAVDSLSGLAKAAGEPDSLTDAVVTRNSSDTTWLLLGTQRGLRRGVFGGTEFPPVSLPGIADTAEVPITRLLARGARVFAFTGNRFFVSSDAGATFTVAAAEDGMATDPARINGYAETPDGAFSGDSLWVNFHLDRPGLMLFRRDTLLRNEGAGEIADALIDAEDSLDIVRGQGRLTQVATVASGNRSAVAVGTTGKGLFYRLLPSSSQAWTGLNRLRSLEGSLGEIITYPTLLTGQLVDGEPEVMRIGYRLKKDARVTITVFNYAMEKVKVLVRNGRRRGGVRSEDPSQDFWDGRDASGRRVSVGPYYILVETDGGEKGWGKGLVVRGRS